MKKIGYVFSLVIILFSFKEGFCNSIYIGSITTDITPLLPVAVDGQMHLRVTDIIETPLEANILVLDSREGNQSLESVIFITCDLVTIPIELRDMIQNMVKRKLPAIDIKKIIINATHTHTGAVVRDGWYLIPKRVTQPSDYVNFISEKISDAVVKAWTSRKPGSMSWGINEAKVAFNRRAVYADGRAQMYGKTNMSDFRGIEGYEDQNINTLFFWDNKGKVIATCVNVASPAQIAERRTAINADYWHPVRVSLRKQLGKNLTVLGWIGAGGDQTPRPMYGHKAIERMFKLQGINEADIRSDYYMETIADKIVKAVLETYEVVKNDLHNEVELIHETETIYLPMRIVTDEEYEYSKGIRDQDLSDPENAKKYHRRIVWHEEVLDRYENQKIDPNPKYKMELNILRIGDVAICTNSFELFTDYGIQIQARSKALQTFIIQLVGPGTYLPTERAVKGGHYSAIVQSNRVGPEGGEILVDRTVDIINSLWTD